MMYGAIMDKETHVLVFIDIYDYFEHKKKELNSAVYSFCIEDE